MQTVLCNNNWTAVSFHLLRSSASLRNPCAPRREEEKEEDGSLRKGVDEGREGGQSGATATTTTKMILVRRDDDEWLRSRDFTKSRAPPRAPVRFATVSFFH